MSGVVPFTPHSYISFLNELDSNAKLGGSQTWLRKIHTQTAMTKPTF
jgi:hypothetical protein